MIKIVASDLDGTLFDKNFQITDEDYNSLVKLGQKGIHRAVITGRNFLSAMHVLQEDFPIDYLVFSSGAGIFDWQKKELLHSHYLEDRKVERISALFIKENVDFMIHKIIPHNHKFYYHRSSRYNPDFERRIELYKDYAFPLVPDDHEYDHACQFVAVFGQDHSLFYRMAAKMNDVKYIRTTSPLDHASLWMEIFPENVSKGHGLQWLCNYLDIPLSASFAIGNDYNDLDMLEYAHLSYVVDNAPKDLKILFHNCPTNTKNGFSTALRNHLKDF